MGECERGPLKKLTEAAQHWARPAKKPKAQALTVDDEFAEGLRKVGVSEADIEAQQVAADAEPVEAAFEVHEDAWESWLFFLHVSRQWVYVVMGNAMGSVAVRQCLNWPAIEALARMSGTSRRQWPGLCADLLVIEEAVLVAESENNKG